MKILGKIIPLLGSNQIGEVAAAAAACERVLRQGGRDWYWLAGLASGNAPTSPIHIAYLEAEVRNLRTRLGAVGKVSQRLASDVEGLRRENARLAQLNASLQIQLRQAQRSEDARAPEPAGRGDRIEQRARMLIRSKLSTEDRAFVHAVSRSRSNHLSGGVRDRFERLWSEFRRGS